MEEEPKKQKIEKEKQIVPQEQKKKKEITEIPKKSEEKNEKSKKNESIVNGKNLGISTKHAVAICNYIRSENIDAAIAKLEQVENFKKAIPMKGEIPHRKGKIMSGRYPIKAVKEIVKLLKSLKANAIVDELELEKYVIFCKANVAARPYRRFGQTKFKRSHVTLKLILPVKKIKKSISDKTSSNEKEKVKSTESSSKKPITDNEKNKEVKND